MYSYQNQTVYTGRPLLRLQALFGFHQLFPNAPFLSQDFTTKVYLIALTPWPPLACNSFLVLIFYDYDNSENWTGIL